MFTTCPPHSQFSTQGPPAGLDPQGSPIHLLSQSLKLKNIQEGPLHPLLCVATYPQKMAVRTDLV